MLATSKINLVNKYKEPVKVSTYYLHKSGKYYVEEVHTEPVYFCKEGDLLGLISKCTYTYRDGFFYLVINKRNVIFMIDEEFLKIEGVFVPDDIYVTNTPLYKYTDFEDFKFFI